jgi:dihydrodipicolinate synthase/N-acetylneuraminate lyase
VKFAASLLGFTTPQCRLPMAPISAENAERVRTAMAQAGLLEPGLAA